MTITEADFKRVANAVLAAGGVSEQSLAALKAQWPDWRFHLCHEDEIPARLRPLIDETDFSLYAIGSGDHCVALTNDPEKAIGFVLAEKTHES
jgi:hypothetical protein